MVVASLADEPSDTAGDAGGDGRAALLGERTTTDTEDGGVVRRAALLGRLVTSSSEEEDGEDKLMVAIAAATCLPRREAGKDGGILGAMAGIDRHRIAPAPARDLVVVVGHVDDSPAHRAGGDGDGGGGVLAAPRSTG